MEGREKLDKLLADRPEPKKVRPLRKRRPAPPTIPAIVMVQAGAGLLRRLGIDERIGVASKLCWGCRKRASALERAHIVAHSKGGSDTDPKNFLLLCSFCHRSQPDMAAIEVQLRWLEERHKRLIALSSPNDILLYFESETGVYFYKWVNEYEQQGGSGRLKLMLEQLGRKVRRDSASRASGNRWANLAVALVDEYRMWEIQHARRSQ